MKKIVLPFLVVIFLIAVGGTFLYRSDRHSGDASRRGSADTESTHQHAPGGRDAEVTDETIIETEEEAPAVEISLEKQRMLGVETAEAQVKSIKKTIRTVGRIEYDETGISTINTKFDGWIEKLYVDFVGRSIRKGEPLAELYSPELIATQQELINLQRWAEKNRDLKDKDIAAMLSQDALTLIEAARQRLRLWDITDSQIRKIEETGKPIRTLTIYSPVNGYLVQKNALQGMRVMAGERLMDVADLSTVWIMADVYEYELPLVKVGSEASIGLSYFPGREFKSKVDYIYPVLSGETRTAKVRFRIPNTGKDQLKPQMYSDIYITIDLGPRLTVPSGAVIDTGTRHIVYVDKGDEYFEPREIVPGLKAEKEVEVLRGLSAGERVATSATFLIDSEAQLRGIKPLGGQPHAH